MRFKLGGRVYDAASVDDVTLKDTLLFEQQMSELGRTMSWPDLMEMVVRLAYIEDPVARGAHPDANWSLAVTIWASRRAAGEDVTVSQAADFRMRDLEWIDPPEAAPDPPVDQAGDAPGLVEVESE